MKTTKSLLQTILDRYQTGINVIAVEMQDAQPPKEVKPAFDDAVKAREDQVRLINEAEAYMNDILPKARGEAARITEKAEGYKAEVISQAKGNASRFNAIYKQYAAGKDVTKNRLYLETVESILEESDKIIMGGEGMLPHMSVNQKHLFENK